MAEPFERAVAEALFEHCDRDDAHGRHQPVVGGELRDLGEGDLRLRGRVVREVGVGTGVGHGSTFPGTCSLNQRLLIHPSKR